MDKINLKNLGKLLPIIGFVIFIYIIYDIGLEKIVEAFFSIPIQLFVLALILVFIRLFVYTNKWRYICKKMKINIKKFDLLKIYLIGIFYGNLTPGALGLHLRIFYMRKKSKVSIGKCLANSIIDMELALITGIFIGLIGTIYLIDYYPGLVPVLLILLLLHLSLITIFMKKSGGSKFFKIFLRPLIPKKYREGIDQSIELLYEDMPKIREMLYPIILDVIAWIIIGTQVFIIAQAFSIDIPYIVFLMLHTISVVAYGILPITVGGLGIREGIFVFLLLPFGVEAEVAFVISLCGYLVKMIIPALGGMFLSFKER
jgi:uncharacterized protein (TIRG00374 family)